MKIRCVVVLYNANKERVFQIVQGIVGQVDGICFVDNSRESMLNEIESIFSYESDNFCLNYLPLNDNKGIAYAQNRGVDFFISHNFDYVLFCDQDSDLPKGTVNKLLNAHIALQNEIINVGVVGTMPFNKVTKMAYPLKSMIINSNLNINGIKLTETYSLISSASLIKVSCFGDVGYFNEKLFIDGVDHEWCWRAWHLRGLRSFVVDDAIIYHYFGEGDRNIGTKKVSIASSKRLFYQYRNYLWLCRMPYTPRYWKKKNGIKYAVKLFYYPLFISPRMKNLNNILKGIIAGCKGYGTIQ